jgi:cobalt/nickel transport system permease protein
MALPALIVYLSFAGLIRRSGSLTAAILSFAAGFAAVLLGAVIAGIFLILDDPRMANVVKVILAAHFPLALIEGVVTLFMVGFLKKTAPDILN